MTETLNRPSLLAGNPALLPENLAETFFHKLSQPIGAIYASLEVGLMSDDARQLKAAIEAGLTQLEVLRWLFQIARQFLATDFCVRARSISLRECIAIAVNDWRPLADAKEITFLISAPQDSHVLADPIYLRDAVGNLLSRSVRSSHRTSVISVAIVASGSTAQIEISDQTPYDARSGENPFEPFPLGVQIGPGESGNLDLALSQRIIRAFGGDLELRGTPKGNNCFRIVLPRHNP